MRKFRIKDEDGRDYTVEEMIEEKTEDAEESLPEAPAPVALSEDEIVQLKELLSVKPQLMELLSKKEEVADEEPEEEEEEGLEVEEEEDDEIADDGEEVIETEKNIAHDSKQAFGAIEQHTTVDDSLNDDVNVAWANKYNKLLGRNK